MHRQNMSAVFVLTKVSGIERARPSDSRTVVVMVTPALQPREPMHSKPERTNGQG